MVSRFELAHAGADAGLGVFVAIAPGDEDPSPIVHDIVDRYLP